MYDKKTDLAGPGISTYEEVSKILPANYKSLLPPLKRMEALYMIKEYIEKGLAEARQARVLPYLRSPPCGTVSARRLCRHDSEE